MSKVNCSYTEAIRAMPSMCDETSRISIPGFLDMFQDIAGYHAKTIGIGALELEEKGLFWIVSKVRLKINSRPLVQEMLEDHLRHGAATDIAVANEQNRPHQGYASPA